jgi:hypothetical protein
MKISPDKNSPPKKSTKTDRIQFWRAKKKIAYNHMKRAKSTGNGGWYDMLQQRIQKYDNKIDTLTEDESGTELQSTEAETPKAIITPWPRNMLNVVEHIKNLGEGGPIDPYFTKLYIQKFKNFKIKTGTEIGNGAVYVALYLDSLQSSPRLNTSSTLEDVEKFLIDHIEVKGADVFFDNSKIEVKDAEAPFRVGASGKTVAKGATLFAPLNNLVDEFKTKYEEHFKNLDDQEALDEFNKYAEYFEPTVSWGPKKYEFFVSTKGKLALSSLKDYVYSKMDDESKDKFDRKGFTNNLLDMLSDLETNEDITTRGQYIKKLNDLIKKNKDSSFGDVYKDIFSEIKDKAEEINKGMQTLSTSIMGRSDLIYFTKQNGFTFADINNVANVIKVTSVSAGRGIAVLNV